MIFLGLPANHQLGQRNLRDSVFFMKRYLPFFIVGATASTVLAGTLLCQTMQPHRLTISGDQAVSASAPTESVHIRGNPNAPVTLEEFGDFECPSCKNLATFLDQVVREYHPRVRLIFRNYPLAMHHYARDAALAAEAAGLQGRYWEMHDTLYREQPVWSSSNDVRTLFISYAETLGLDPHDPFPSRRDRRTGRPGGCNLSERAGIYW